MGMSQEKLDALVDAALKSGETIESYGNFDEDSDEGRDVELIQHGGLWLVVERNDDDEDDISPYTDEAEARLAFEEAKYEILKDEGDD